MQSCIFYLPITCAVSLCAFLVITAQPPYRCIYPQMMHYLVLLVTKFFLACCVLLYSAVMRWEYTYRLRIVVNLDFQGQYQHQLGAYYSCLMCFAYFLSYRPLENVSHVAFTERSILDSLCVLENNVIVIFFYTSSNLSF